MLRETFTLEKSYMLSGMNPKPSAVTEAQLEAFYAAGHTVTVLKPRKVKRHWLRTKSHLVSGGVGSRYMSGGTRNKAGRSRKCV